MYKAKDYLEKYDQKIDYFLDRCKKELDLVSVVMYGSYVRGDYTLGHSDLDLVVVLKDGYDFKNLFTLSDILGNIREEGFYFDIKVFTEKEVMNLEKNFSFDSLLAKEIKDSGEVILGEDIVTRIPEPTGKDLKPALSMMIQKYYQNFLKELIETGITQKDTQSLRHLLVECSRAVLSMSRTMLLYEKGKDMQFKEVQQTMRDVYGIESDLIFDDINFLKSKNPEEFAIKKGIKHVRNFILNSLEYMDYLQNRTRRL